VEYPEHADHGDYATNVALVATKTLKKPPMEIAQMLADALAKDAALSELFKKIEVAKPGFINFFVSPQVLQRAVAEILKEKALFGKGARTKQSVNIEFISANPTGPLTLANGRGGFYGDVLGNVLEFSGTKVEKEYYVNDAGNQIKNLGESVLAAGGVLPAEAHHYQGAYIMGYAKEFTNELNEHRSDPEALGKRVASAILDREIKPPVERAGIHFDRWTSEFKDIREKGLVTKSMEALAKKGLVYEKDGATWLKTSEYGDDKDRVLVKSIGNKDMTMLR